MLSIDWGKAPEWARYAARDQSGKWWWHSEKPQIIGSEWLPRYVNEYWTQIERAEIRCPIHWRLSLMKRPTINRRATQAAKGENGITQEKQG